MEYWNDGFMDSYYLDEGWRCVWPAVDLRLKAKNVCLVPHRSDP
jgi:hypothetical protein